MLLVATSWSASAQETLPPTAPSDHRYTTKPTAAIAMPFGPSTASQERPVTKGPPSVDAVPVENVDTIETGEPLPAESVENEADPVKEDPSQPTQLTAPIFTAQSTAAQRISVLRVLNKVTTRTEKLELKEAQSLISGKLRVSASHCQHSDPTSLPDDAALITVSEIIAADQPDKLLFSGWMYQSSPSINGLEHPIYDVTLVACKDPPQPVKPLEKKGSKKPPSNQPVRQ